MLRKRSRTVQDQSKVQLMVDLSSSSCFSHDSATEQKTRRSSFFIVPGLLVSFTGKSLSESDSMRSPTSPLDYRIFSNLASSIIRTPRSPGRSWDCSGSVGLGLVNSLRDDKFSGGGAESKNILLGSHMRLTNIINTKNLFNFAGDEHSEPKGSPFSKIRPSKLELESDSCSSDHLQQTQNCNFDVSSVEFFHGSMGCLSASEDYTCIISHGPNPKTTHIFGDRILESSVIESHDSENKQGREGGESHWIIQSSENSPPLPSSDFLSFCYFCDKKLEEGRDIYMYRGDMAFCSWNCREQVILIEEESKKESLASGSCHFPASSSFHEDLFKERMAVSS